MNHQALIVDDEPDIRELLELTLRRMHIETRSAANLNEAHAIRLKEFNDKYTQYCLKRAEAEYKTHGRWFYCEDKKEFRGNIRWDEVITARVFMQLSLHYGSLEKIPNYSKENHQKAIEFWQKWQKKHPDSILLQ